MILRKIKNIVAKLYNGSFFLKLTNKYERKWFGSNYGGFFLNPNGLNSSSIIYSIGIGEDISFDLEIIKEYNCNVFGYDPTPKAINWIKCQSLPSKFHFFSFGLGSFNGQAEFYLPKNEENVSGSILRNSNRINNNNIISVEIRTLKHLMEINMHSKIDVLKMDIEGAEYDVLKRFCNEDIRPRQIIIEFHSRFFKFGLFKTLQSVRELKKLGYKLFAISSNGEEMSFILSETI
jgi:FkbM family methyltransferase